MDCDGTILLEGPSTKSENTIKTYMYKNWDGLIDFESSYLVATHGSVFLVRLISPDG